MTERQPLVQASIDWSGVVHRAIKYLINGFMVALAAYFIPGKVMKLESILMISLVATSTFALLDMFMPSVSLYAKMGAMYGIGANLVGFPGNALNVARF